MLVSPISDSAELTQIKHVFSHHDDSDTLLSSAQHEAIFDAMPNGLVVLNNKGMVIQANAQASNLLGVALLNQTWREVIAQAFDPKANDGHEVSLKNGLLVKVSTSPLANHLGQLIVITDLTETRLLQARISHMQRLSSLGKMVATLAHQIRTPLSSAMLYAANLKSQDMPFAARQKFSGKILDRLKELESQVNDMLLFAKSGEQQVVANISLGQLLDTLSNTISGIENKYQHQLQYALDIDEKVLDTTHILGNQTALVGALENLIDNAFQVTPTDNTVTLQVVLTAEHVCQFHIIDQGPGIAPAKLKQVFTPFFTTKTHGTGLGLAVVQSVAKSHHGSVSVQNNAQGATFTLSLPCQPLHSTSEK